MGFAKLSKTQVLLLLRHIRNTDRDLYDYIRTIRKMKKILPVICGNGDVHTINTTQVAGTTATVGAVAASSSDCLDNVIDTCIDECLDECYGADPCMSNCMSNCTAEKSMDCW